MKSLGALCAATVVAVLGIVFIAQAQAPESSDHRAVREALDKWRLALNNEDLAALLATLSDDAVIDSSAARRKVDKKDYQEIMKFVMDGHYTGKFTIKGLKITLPDSTHATGEGMLDRDGVARKHRWNLEKRAGKWLIVGTEYLK